jgi:hypothetical protein
LPQKYYDCVLKDTAEYQQVIFFQKASDNVLLVVTMSSVRIDA